MIGVAMAPSISLEKGTETVMKMERKIMQFEEVDETVSRIGRPEAGSSRAVAARACRVG